jgi:hypothetical protein
VIKCAKKSSDEEVKMVQIYQKTELLVSVSLTADGDNKNKYIENIQVN